MTHDGNRFRRAGQRRMNMTHEGESEGDRTMTHDGKSGTCEGASLACISYSKVINLNVFKSDYLHSHPQQAIRPEEPPAEGSGKSAKKKVRKVYLFFLN